MQIQLERRKWIISRLFIPSKIVLYISRPFSKFHSRPPQEGVFIDRINRIDPIKSYNFNVSILFTSVSYKIIAKCGILCPKTLVLAEKQLVRQYISLQRLFAPWRSRNSVRITKSPITGKSFMAFNKVARETYILLFCGCHLSIVNWITNNAIKIVNKHDKSQKLLKDSRTVTYVHGTTIHQEKIYY